MVRLCFKCSLVVKIPLSTTRNSFPSHHIKCSLTLTLILLPTIHVFPPSHWRLLSLLSLLRFYQFHIWFQPLFHLEIHLHSMPRPPLSSKQHQLWVHILLMSRANTPSPSPPYLGANPPKLGDEAAAQRPIIFSKHTFCPNFENLKKIENTKKN